MGSRQPHSDAVVTGMGAVSALGTGCDAHLQALLNGASGIRKVARFDTAGLGSRWAATFPGWDGRVQPEPGPERDLASCAAVFPVLEIATLAAREAWASAALDTAIERGIYERSRIALVVGTCFGQGYRDFHEIGEQLATLLGSTGPCITISTACASSANAVGLARDLITTGRADVVLAGGVDALLREAFAGFSALGVLSPDPCAPFSTPAGTTLGEGAAFVAVERADRASSREVRLWALISGYGLSADAHHETSPDPGGQGIGRAIRGAVSDAGWPRDSIDYVNAHATGTSSNDSTEWSAIRRELGPHVLVSAPKSLVGHTQGASGALELVLALLAMSRGSVPATANFRGARPGCPADPAAGDGLRAHSTTRALKLTAAFGGANAVVAYAPPTVRSERASSVENAALPVLVRSVVVIGAGGPATTSEELMERGVESGKIRELGFERLAPNVDPRRLDRSSRSLIAATSLCLDRAGVSLKGDARNRAGLFVAATRMPEESAHKCKESVRYKGVGGTSASAFARMSVNAPTGACARALAIRGPSTTVSIGEGSALLSIILAADWLARRDDADVICAAGVDEVNPAGGDTEAAFCGLLERSTGIEPEASAVRIDAWGIAGPDDLERAVADAWRSEAPPDLVVTDGVLRTAAGCVIDVSTIWGRAEGVRSAVAFALAVAHLNEGRARSALVVGVQSRSTACAIALTR